MRSLDRLLGVVITCGFALSVVSVRFLLYHVRASSSPQPPRATLDRAEALDRAEEDREHQQPDEGCCPPSFLPCFLPWNARQDKRQEKAGQARQDKTRQDKTRQDKARQNKTSRAGTKSPYHNGDRHKGGGQSQKAMTNKKRQCTMTKDKAQKTSTEAHHQDNHQGIQSLQG